jgi:hypothetical protein
VKPLELALTACLAAAPAFAQSNVRNADLQPQPAGDLTRTFAALADGVGPMWIGYTVPAASPEWNSCCWDHGGGCCGACSIEPRSSGAGPRPSAGAAQAGPVKLEDQDVVVLFRVAERRVERIRAFSSSCAIDAGGRRVYWLNGVDPAASVELLAAYAGTAKASGERRGRVADGALMAIAAHAAPTAVPTLIRIANSGQGAHTRGQALFWLAQRAGQEAVGPIAEAIENDPDTQVKTRAVFALSQLPDNEGVPKLIEVARANRNPKVRQQAIFWLGQSRDPRALKFFEEILSR